MCEAAGYDYEIIFINDGSSDKTDQICRTLKPLKYIQFRRNFGQTAAMDAGIKAATKEFIATLDGDGQNDPADIPKMLEYMQEHQYDVVSGWRKNRKDTFMKRFISRGANALRYLLVHDGIHDGEILLFKGVSQRMLSGNKPVWRTASLYSGDIGD